MTLRQRLQSRARRFQAVLYQLAGGTTTKKVPLAEVVAECERIGIMEMTPEQFERWESTMLADVKEKRP